MRQEWILAAALFGLVQCKEQEILPESRPGGGGALELLALLPTLELLELLQGRPRRGLHRLVLPELLVLPAHSPVLPVLLRVKQERQGALPANQEPREAAERPGSQGQQVLPHRTLLALRQLPSQGPRWCG